jgi:hypothetical protein
MTPARFGSSLLLFLFGCTGGDIMSGQMPDDPAAPAPNPAPGGTVTRPGNPGPNGIDPGPNVAAPARATFIPGALGCAPGETPTFHGPTRGTGSFSSGIEPGPGGPPLTMTCEAGSSCAPGQVAVEFSAFGSGAASQCVEAPPACAQGEFPAYRPGSNGAPDFGGRGIPGGSGQVAAGWFCSNSPCDVVVEFGGLYGGFAVCAGAPPACQTSEIPLFSVADQAWTCVVGTGGSCPGGGANDPAYLANRMVCVPC